MMIITQKITSLACEIHDGKNLEIDLSALKKILFRQSLVWDATVNFLLVEEGRGWR